MNINSFPHIKKIWRKGKWTEEEEFYAEKIVESFNAGILDISTGTTLRSALSELLNCDPMRITKKFSGSCIGKQLYQPATRTEQQTSQLIELKTELEKAKKHFLNMVERSYDLQNSNFLLTTMTPYSQMLQEYVPVMVEPGENYHKLIHQNNVASLQQYPSSCGYLNLPSNYHNHNHNQDQVQGQSQLQNINHSLDDTCHPNHNVGNNIMKLSSTTPTITFNQLQHSKINPEINANVESVVNNHNRCNCNCNCNCNNCTCNNCNCYNHSNCHDIGNYHHQQHHHHYRNPTELKIPQTNSQQSIYLSENKHFPYYSSTSSNYFSNSNSNSTTFCDTTNLPFSSSTNTTTNNTTNTTNTTSFPFIHSNIQYYQYLQSQINYQEQNKFSEFANFRDEEWGISSEYDINSPPRLAVLFYTSSNITNQPYIYLPPKYNLQYSHIFQNEKFQESVPMLSGYSIHPTMLAPKLFPLNNIKQFNSSENQETNISLNSTRNINSNDYNHHHNYHKHKNINIDHHHHLHHHHHNSNSNNNGNDNNTTHNINTHQSKNPLFNLSVSPNVNTSTNLSNSSNSTTTTTNTNTTSSTTPSSSTSLSDISSTYSFNNNNNNNILNNNTNDDNMNMNFPLTSFSTYTNTKTTPTTDIDSTTTYIVPTLSSCNCLSCNSLLPNSTPTPSSYSTSSSSSRPSSGLLLSPSTSFHPYHQSLCSSRDSILPHTKFYDSSYSLSLYPPISQVSYPKGIILHKNNKNENTQQNESKHHHQQQQHNLTNQQEVSNLNYNSGEIPPSSVSGVSLSSSLPFYLNTQPINTGLHYNNYSHTYPTSQSYEIHNNNANAHLSMNIYNYNNLIKKRKLTDSI